MCECVPLLDAKPECTLSHNPLLLHSHTHMLQQRKYAAIATLFVTAFLVSVMVTVAKLPRAAAPLLQHVVLHTGNDEDKFRCVAVHTVPIFSTSFTALTNAVAFALLPAGWPGTLPMCRWCIACLALRCASGPWLCLCLAPSFSRVPECYELSALTPTSNKHYRQASSPHSCVSLMMKSTRIHCLCSL